MNYKQKFGYTLLGAIIMAVGIIIGQVITPNIEAQKTGGFETIYCHELQVVDKQGHAGIVLKTYDKQGMKGSALSLYKHGKPTVILASNEGKDGTDAIYIYGKNQEPRLKVEISETDSKVKIYDKQGRKAISLESNEQGNGYYIGTIFFKKVMVSSKYGKSSAGLFGFDDISAASVEDRYGNNIWRTP